MRNHIGIHIVRRHKGNKICAHRGQEMKKVSVRRDSDTKGSILVAQSVDL